MVQAPGNHKGQARVFLGLDFGIYRRQTNFLITSCFYLHMICGPLIALAAQYDRASSALADER